MSLRRCWNCKGKLVDHETHFTCNCGQRWNARGEEIPETTRVPHGFKNCLSPKDSRRQRKVAGRSPYWA